MLLNQMGEFIRYNFKWEREYECPKIGDVYLFCWSARMRPEIFKGNYVLLKVGL